MAETPRIPPKMSTIVTKPSRKTRRQRGSSTSKMVYAFGGDRSEGKGSQHDLLGGKGANLAEMCEMGLPVPPGFTITTEQCAAWFASGGTMPSGLMDEVREQVFKAHGICLQPELRMVA